MSPNRVLIVDDSKDVVRVLQAAFVTLDASLLVSSVSTAEEALLDVIRNPVHLMIIDVRLPGISGLDLTRKLRASSRAIKIIQISGIHEPDLHEQALEAGADVFLRKPVSVNELLATSRKMLGLAKPEPTGQKPAEAKPAEELSPLNKFLGEIRQRLGAELVAIAARGGQWIAQAGEFPAASLETALISVALAHLGTLEKTSLSLGGETPESVLTCKGSGFDLLVTPVGYAHVLVVLLVASRTGVRLAIAQDELFTVQEELRKILTRQGFELVLRKENTASLGKRQPVLKTAGTGPVSSPQKTTFLQPHPGEAESEQDLEVVFSKSARGRPTPDELDTFWSEAAARGEGLPASDSDMISYEQALKMGLTPGQAGS